MNELSFFSAFLIGVAGGVHCLGMCGGITVAMRAASPNHQSHLAYACSYHFGRIISYSIAGALTGALGLLVSSSSSYANVILHLFSIVMLTLMALYIGQWFRGLIAIEKLGQSLWQYLQPLSKRFMPFKTPMHAFPYGMIWGWLPCGLVYSTLSWSLASKNPMTGAGIMLAFGLGTFPVMLASSLAANRLLKLIRHPLFRQLIALSLIGYALYLLLKII